MKGIILAGGSGTLCKSILKQLFLITSNKKINETKRER